MKKVLVVALIVAAISYFFAYFTVIGNVGSIYAQEITEETRIEEVKPLSVVKEKPVGFEMDINYGELMVYAASMGQIERGKEYERMRNLKKEYMGIADDFTFDNLYLLAKIVEVEAGSTWITDEHKQLVASVVVNRVNSSRFPNTIRDVIYAPGQYSLVGTEYFENLVPTYISVLNAAHVLTRGSIAPDNVVFQANFPQGTGIYKTFTPEKLGTTYFCYGAS